MTAEVTEFVVRREPVKLDTREERLAYFNENAKPLFGPTFVVIGPNRRVAATGDMEDMDGFFERFCDWCDAPEALKPKRLEWQG